MNAEDLLALATNQAEADRRATLEREVAADPEAAEVLRRLEGSINLLLDDGLGDLEPPPDLARRTIARVAERRQRRTILEFAPVRVPFRWADVAVAAGIFIAGLLTLLPAVQKGKARVDQAACTFNLHQLGFGLSQYAAMHGSYPYVSSGSPAPRAGTFAVLLHDVGLLPCVAVLDCPGNGASACLPAALPRFEALCRAEAKHPRSSPCLKHIDYAYNLGYRRKSGRLGPIPAQPPIILPLLADRPAQDEHDRIEEGNSPNHGRAGQNVLYTDGHVAWHPSRRISPVDEDLYLNAFNRPAPGVSAEDAVLAPGTFRFDGGH